MFLADAQTTFYVVGIVFMVFLMFVALVLLVLAISLAVRIKAMQKRMKNRLEFFSMFARKGKGFAEGFRRGMGQKY